MRCRGEIAAAVFLLAVAAGAAVAGLDDGPSKSAATVADVPDVAAVPVVVAVVGGVGVAVAVVGVASRRAMSAI